MNVLWAAFSAERRELTLLSRSSLLSSLSVTPPSLGIPFLIVPELRSDRTIIRQNARNVIVFWRYKRFSIFRWIKFRQIGKGFNLFLTKHGSDYLNNIFSMKYVFSFLLKLYTFTIVVYVTFFALKDRLIKQVVIIFKLLLIFTNRLL